MMLSNLSIKKEATTNIVNDIGICAATASTTVDGGSRFGGKILN